MKMTVNVIVSTTGCGVAALSFALLDMWCFALPPLLGSPYLSRLAARSEFAYKSAT
jgi:hypothetical protein